MRRYNGARCNNFEIAQMEPSKNAATGALAGCSLLSVYE